MGPAWPRKQAVESLPAHRYVFSRDASQEEDRALRSL
jgi:hypothetical protein